MSNVVAFPFPFLDPQQSGGHWAWAERQTCSGPLPKLILVHLAFNTGSIGHWHWIPSKLAAFACVSQTEMFNALVELENAGFIKILGESSSDRIEIALPWYTPPESATASRQALWEEQEGRCWYCGSTVENSGQHAHLDHMNPVSRGGTDHVSHIVLACVPCNLRKSDRTIDQYRALLQRASGKAVIFHGERA